MSNEKAVDAFVTEKGKIDYLLERLQKLSNNNFNIYSEDASWSDVGNLNRYKAQLQELVDIAFQEGEYSLPNNVNKYWKWVERMDQNK